MRIKFYDFKYQHDLVREEVLKDFKDFYDSNWFVMGERLKRFEAEFSEYINVSHAVGVANGLDALFLSLEAVGIGPGDEVIVPAHTYIATWLAVTRTGATIVPIDACSKTWNINADLIEQSITPKTRAIIPVHLYGMPCDMPKIKELASKHGLYVIEDNAQAQGAIIAGKKTGSWGTLNATSLYPGKNLGALGDAGIITTDNSLLAQKVKTLRNYGSNEKYLNELKGYNSRLDEYQAGLLSIKLGVLDSLNAARKLNYKRYKHNLSSTDVIFQESTHESESVYHQIIIRAKDRDGLQNFLSEHGVQTLIHYPIPVYKQQAYKEFNWMEYEVSNSLAQEILSLPNYPGLSVNHIDEVCSLIQLFHKK